MIVHRRCLMPLAVCGFVIAAVSANVGSSRAIAAEPAHFHHVHLNVTNAKQSIRFYRRVFGAVPVQFRHRADAVFTERSFILFNEVETPPDPKLNTGIWHIGWGGTDVKSLYEWWRERDVNFHTPLTPLPLGRDNYYMYISGPDQELIEINTMGHHRFAHVHFFCEDVNEAVDWYVEHLGLKPRARSVPKPRTDNMNTFAGIWMNSITCDNVNMIFFGKPDQEPSPVWWPDPPLKEIEPTDNRPIDHIAFSYRDIRPVFERMKAAGADIVQEPKWIDEYGMKSFFVRGPDKVLIEIVEAKPIPEGIWDEPASDENAAAQPETAGP